MTAPEHQPAPPSGELEPIWALVTGRMGSSRMPGKTMAELAGRPSLHHIIDRLHAVPSVTDVVVATTTKAEDDVICTCAQNAGAEVFRGSSDDVLGRATGAALRVQAGTLVLITGDCPLVDPAIVESVIERYRSQRPDYASNALHGYQYPIGMDVEVFPASLLQLVERKVREPRYREHVTLYFYEHPQEFSLLGTDAPRRQRRPDLRLTLDTPADYELISRLYDSLYEVDPYFGLDAVLGHLNRNPELLDLNRHIQQKVP